MFSRRIIPILTLGLFTQICAAQPKPDAPGPVVELTQSLVVSMNQAWERDRNPRILCVFGITDAGRIRYGVKANALDRVAAPLLHELNRAFPGALVAADITLIKERELDGLMERAVGEALSADATAAIARVFQSDILVDVVLLPGGAQGHWATSMDARDTRSASIIATTSLLPFDLESNPQAGHVCATEIARAFGEAYASLHGPGAPERSETYTIQLVSLEGDEGPTSKDFRQLAKRVESDVDGVAWAETDEKVTGDVRGTVLKVRYAGRSRDLLDDIEDGVLAPAELGWNVLRVDGTSISALLYRDVRPMWHVITDTDAAEGRTLLERRTKSLLTQGLPRVAVFMGPELAESGFSASGGAGKPSNADTLRAALENELSELGFTVVDAKSVDRNAGADRQNAARYENLPHMIASLSSLDNVDLVLHVNETSSGAFIGRLIDPRSSQVVGTQFWPDPSASRLSKHRVDPDRADQVARFVCGRLIERWDRQAAGSMRTLDVEIRNVDDPNRILAVLDVIRSKVGGVDSVTDVQIATPVARFEVVHSGGSDTLTLALLDVLGASFPGVEIQRIGAGLIINLNPKPLTEEQIAERTAREVSIAGDSPTSTHQSDARLSPVESVERALRACRDSVWLVYVRLPDGSGWTGTAWTVAPGLLATNAHVVGDVPDRLARGEDVQVIAWNDSSRERTLRLGRCWRHPQWSDRGTPQDFWYDVGMFEVVEGDAGEALPLADSDELRAMVAPICAGYIGFPSKHAFTEATNQLPAKQAFLGQVNAILDTSLTPNQQAVDRMVTHNMTSAQGASGSPIFGESGRVIALLNSGMQATVAVTANSGEAEQVSVPTGFNGGVMVDVLVRFMESVQNDIQQR